MANTGGCFRVCRKNNHITLTAMHRHHLARKPSVRKTSPVPKTLFPAASSSARTLPAIEPCGGARQVVDEELSGFDELLGRFASGKPTSVAVAGRFMPAFIDVLPSIWTSSVSTSSQSPSKRRQGSAGPSRTTMIVPYVPAQRFRVGLRSTQVPQTKLS